MMTKQRKYRLKCKIQASRGRLMETHPFFAILLMYLKFVSVPQMRKMSVNGRCIYFNPDFVDKLYEYELDYMLCHQIMHITAEHIWRPEDCAGDNYHFACDIWINSNLAECGFTEERYPHLGEVHCKIPGKDLEIGNMSVQEIYDNLPYDLYILDDRARNRILADSDFLWDRKDDSGSLGEVVVDISDKDGILKEDEDVEVSYASKLDALKQKWKGKSVTALKSMSGKEPNPDLVGNVPEFIKRMVKLMREPVLEWKKILNNFIQEQTCDYSFSPPDRRFSETDFFLPDFNEKDFVTKEILFMADTSCSVKDEELAMVYSEIKGAIEQFGGKLIAKLGFFDTQVTPPLPFESVSDLMNIVPYGGGGTDFNAIFDYIRENGPEEFPACVVIFTDGKGPCPDESEIMGLPVLWVLNNSYVTPPWGKVARI